MSNSRATGGRFFQAQSAAGLARAYAEIARELRSQYLLTYSSDGLKVESKKKAKVRVELRHRELVARTMRLGCPAF